MIFFHEKWKPKPNISYNHERCGSEGGGVCWSVRDNSLSSFPWKMQTFKIIFELCGKTNKNTSRRRNTQNKQNLILTTTNNTNNRVIQKFY